MKKDITKIILGFGVFFTCFMHTTVYSQAIEVNERHKFMAVNAGQIGFYPNYLDEFSDIPRGIVANLVAGYYWKQNNNRATRASVGIQYEQMFRFEQSRTYTHLSSVRSIEKSQQALYLQMELLREIPFGQTKFYSLWALDVNIKLMGLHSGQTFTNSLTENKVETYTQKSDPYRKAAYSLISTGIGYKVGEYSAAELKIGGGLSPNSFHKAALFAGIGFHFPISKPDMTVKKLFS